MAFQRWVCFCWVVIFFTSCLLMGWVQAYQFNVGGKQGWVLNPSENYNHWAQRMRFQVNDTLFFKYKKGSDSVLVVSNQDYDQCNTENPITKMDGGDSVFNFDRSGPFFFISGNKDNCDKGQKIIIVVMAVRNKPKSTPPSPAVEAPAPSTSSPAPTPSSESLSPVMSPTPVTEAPVPTPSSAFPAPLMSPTPATESPVPTPSSGFPAPLMSPTPAWAPATEAPVPTPSSGSPAPVVSPAPETAPGSPSPAATLAAPTPSTDINPSPATSTLSPAENAPSPGGSTANINSTAPPHSSAPAFTPNSFVFISSVTVLLLGVCNFFAAP